MSAAKCPDCGAYSTPERGTSGPEIIVHEPGCPELAAYGQGEPTDLDLLMIELDDGTGTCRYCGSGQDRRELEVIVRPLPEPAVLACIDRQACLADQGRMDP